MQQQPSSLFAKAAQGLPLSPEARALLRLIEGFIVAGFVAALPVAASALSQQTIDWQMTGRLALSAFLVAVLMAVSKYFKAHADQPLALPITTVLDTTATNVPGWLGVNDVKTPVQLPPDIAAAMDPSPQVATSDAPSPQ